MKKTFSRAFSLLLVLALLVSVIPAALAADVPVDIGGSKSVEVGKTTELSVSTQDTGVTNWVWSSKNNDIATVNSATGVVTGVSAGTTTIEVTGSVTTGDGEEAVTTNYKGSTQVTVTAPVSAATITINSKPETIAYSQEVSLTATLTPPDATDTVTWESSNPTAVSITTANSGATIKGLVVDGTSTITAKVNDNVKDTFTVTVEKASVTASLEDIPTTLQPKGTKDANFDISPLAQADVTAVWESLDSNILTVDASSGLITAVATGKTRVKLTLTLSDDKFANYQFTGTGVTGDGKSITLTSGDISVSEGSITMNTTTADLKSGSGSTAFTVTSVQLPDNISSSDIKYDWSKETKGGADVSVSVDSSTGKVTVTNPTGEGSVSITLKALHKATNAVIAQTTITIGVYQEHSIYLTLKSTAGSTFTFDEKVFSYAKIDDSVKNASTITLQSALTGNTAYGSIKLALGNEGILTLSGTSASAYLLSSLKATVNAGKSGTQKISYTWTGDSGVKVAEGILYITVGETTGDIVYNTSYTEKVIFDDSDFTKFWNAKVSSGDVSGTLDYITFEDMKTGVNPKYGQLYYDTACKNPVNTSMEFTTTSRTGYYLLDNVTYKPDSSITTAVTVQIPFTAYSTGISTTRKSVDGVIVININQETTTITSYGVQFGNGTSSIADYIADTYKANTNATLGYVTFPSITTSTGKLYYKFSGVLKSPLVSKNDKFYAKPTGTQFDLDDVVFVPRAGLYGEVTLYYYAYDASGNNEYKGTIALNVKEKTKSAEFSDVGTSLSWAADSVDFLNYEGVAQGSNGKYRPSANITRGDFMLMLYRAFLEDEHKNDSITSNFSDVVKGSDTYSKETYQAVGVAKKLGIAQGTNGKFNPKSYITRQEAMTLIYRTLDEANYDLEYTVSTSTSSFKDYSSVASYAKTAISDLIGHGIVIGNNNKINPTSNITRAEMAVILHRVLTY